MHPPTHSHTHMRIPCLGVCVCVCVLCVGVVDLLIILFNLPFSGCCFKDLCLLYYLFVCMALQLGWFFFYCCTHIHTHTRAQHTAKENHRQKSGKQTDEPVIKCNVISFKFE